VFPIHVAPQPRECGHPCFGRATQSRNSDSLLFPGRPRSAHFGRSPKAFSSECFFNEQDLRGNLPFTADEAAVRTLFSTHGTVESVALISDRDTGQPRGFGFVEMSNADAARAIQNLNGHQMDGRALKVNEAQPKTDRPRRAW